jgi:hypothetical protein
LPVVFFRHFFIFFSFFTLFIFLKVFIKNIMYIRIFEFLKKNSLQPCHLDSDSNNQPITNDNTGPTSTNPDIDFVKLFQGCHSKIRYWRRFWQGCVMPVIPKPLSGAGFVKVAGLCEVNNYMFYKNYVSVLYQN